MDNPQIPKAVPKIKDKPRTRKRNPNMNRRKPVRTY